MDSRLIGLGSIELMNAAPWGSAGLPPRDRVVFDLPEDRVRSLACGDVVRCTVQAGEWTFELVVGPLCHSMGSPESARFLYPLSEQWAEGRTLPLAEVDLLMPPCRVQRTPKRFSPDGYPFQRVGSVGDVDSLLFTSHPTIQTNPPPDMYTYDWPAGARPSPPTAEILWDYSLAWDLVHARWRQRSGR